MIQYWWVTKCGITTTTNVTTSAQYKPDGGSWTAMNDTSGNIGAGIDTSSTIDRTIKWDVLTQLGEDVFGVYRVRAIAYDGALRDTVENLLIFRLGKRPSPASSDALLPLTIRWGTAAGSKDTCLVSSRDWSLVFSENNGSGIYSLKTDSMNIGTNQLSTRNLFNVIHGGDSSFNKTGSSLSIIDTSSLFASLRQSTTLTGLNFINDYTIYGSGKMYVSSNVYSTSAVSGNALKFNVSRAKSGTVVARPKQANWDSASYVHLGDNGSDAHDLLFSKMDILDSLDGFDTLTGASPVYAGFKDNSYSIGAYEKDAFYFMIDFGHTAWNDTSSATNAAANEYRNPDSLQFTFGTLRGEKTWEEQLRGWWPMDSISASDSVYDNSGYYYDARKSSGAAWKPGLGKLGSAIKFIASDGSDTVKVVDGECEYFEGGGGFTVMAWVKCSLAVDANTRFLTKHDGTTYGWYFGTNGSKQLELKIGTATSTGSIALSSTGVWYHVAASYWGSQVKLYVNGQPDIQVSTAGVAGTTTKDLLMGIGLTGLLDDVRYYAEKELDEKTIRGIYNNGFRVADGAYQLRADNNGTVDFLIDGGTYNRNFPVFQVTNYWSSIPSPYVWLDWTSLVYNTDYYTKLDNTNHILWIGLDTQLTSDSRRICIDDDNETVVMRTGPTRQMYLGINKPGSIEYFWAKNFPGSNFTNSTSAREFYFVFKESNTSGDLSGEVWRMKTSAVSGKTGAAADTTATGSLVPGGTSSKTFGCLIFYLNPNYPTSINATAAPTVTFAESSSTRCIIKNSLRTCSGANSFQVASTWTIYPTGQMFRWDSLTSVSVTPGMAEYALAMKGDENADTTRNMILQRGIVFKAAASDSSCDFVGAFLGYKNAGSGFVKNPFIGAGTGVFKNDPGSGSIVNFIGSGSSQTYFESVDMPVQTAFYADIQHNEMGDNYMDSVSNGVQVIKFVDGDMVPNKGNRVIDDPGDLNADGFNEREGAYVVAPSPSNPNAVHFRIHANMVTDDTCRFYPVVKVKNYTANTKPRYVFWHGATGDTTLLLEGYQYNCYLNDPQNYLVLQFDTVICKPLWIYISEDKELAITLSEFYARGGNNNDTLYWRTESEHEHLGFHINRRVSPEFIDSLAKLTDTTLADSLLDYAGLLYKQGTIRMRDTVWLQVTNQMLKGAYGGTSVGPRDYFIVDYQVHNDILYEYTLDAIDFKQAKQSYGPIKVKPGFLYPAKFMLWNNYPNPFRRYTTIKFDLPGKTRISLNVYNLQGRLVTRLIKPERPMEPGWYKVRWNGMTEYGQTVASGPYIYRLVAGKYAKSKVMVGRKSGVERG